MSSKKIAFQVKNANSQIQITTREVDSPTTLKKSKEKTKKEKELLQLCCKTTSDCFEIGIDEAGRGPLFGRVYTAGVVLPKHGSVDFSKVRDSKKMSPKKRKIMSDYIKEHAISYYIHYIEAEEIDRINIRESVLRGMKECVKKNIEELQNNHGATLDRCFIMVDGNDFPPYMTFDQESNKLISVEHETFVGGDNLYTAIAAASILAKVARDEYILDLCEKNILLKEVYGLHTHMGYGTKRHVDAIRENGITQYHRKSFGICKVAESKLGI